MNHFHQGYTFFWYRTTGTSQWRNSVKQRTWLEASLAHCCLL